LSVFIFDTDQLSLYERGNFQVLQYIVRHLSDVIAVSVITVEEQLEGWQRALRQSKHDSQRDGMTPLAKCVITTLFTITTNTKRESDWDLAMATAIGSRSISTADKIIALPIWAK
jgi:hypothetical protein